MKLLNIRNIPLVLSLVVGCVLSVSVRAQTCSGSVISIASGQSCNYLNNSAIPISGTTVNSVITSVANAGTLGSFPGYAIYNDTTSAPGVSNASSTVSIGTITNSGLMDGSGGAGSSGYGILSWAVFGDGSGNSLVASIGSVVNTGTITAGSKIYGVGISLNGITSTLGSLVNASSGIIHGNLFGIDIQGATISSINNLGTISAGAANPDTGINNYGGIIGTITNSGAGVISGFIGILNSGFIATINNSGTISGTTLGIDNTSGYIGTLNNSQGSTNSAGVLKYTGVLPTNYNIIINSPTNYGQLAVTGGTGATNFGIYTGSTVRNGTYAAVLSTSDNTIALTSTSGKYGSASWLLSPEAPCTTSCIWDLIISGYYVGPSVANTNQSLVNTASVLQGTYTLQNSVLANSFSYDCTVFGANDVCVSAGGRNTQVQAANGLNNTSALLIAAYRPHLNYRIGAYADQNLSVSNPGGTVNLGNNTPLIGLFAAWNERLDGTGTEVKVSAAYGQKNTTITRSVVGSGTGASEAGSGSSTLNSQGTQLTAKYGFGVIEDLIVSPYVGVRYTQNNMAGYTEGTSSTVTAPLTYSALNTNATTALAGVGAGYRVIPQVMTFASAGVETDTNTANGTYSATNTSIGTLTPVNFNANPVRTRPTATVGAYYDIEKNQRLGITGIYRQEPYQAVSTTTVLATYTIGL